jgi:HEAT repeat protein
MTSPDAADPRIGTLFGNFRIVRKLGEGGMGTVFEARHDKIGRRAAVKILHPEYAESPEYAERFLNEARSVNIAAHPGLVEIFEYGQQPDGTLYIVMEFLDGQTLYSRMQSRRTLPQAQVAAVALQIARALSTAHHKGIIHRDLKPENIMLIQDPVTPTQERVKVLDFGIAKVDAAQRRLSDPEGERRGTRHGAFIGTPLYMAPEQHGSAESVDGRADVFSLAVVMYELLAGQPPYTGNSISLLQRKPPPVAELNPAVTPAMQALVTRMMAVEPAGRPSMGEVALALEPLAGVLGGGRRWRWRRVGALAAVLLLLLAALLYRAVRPRNLAEARARALGVVREALIADATATRVQAVRALGQSRDYSLRSLAEPMLADEEPQVTATAARALGQLGDPAAQPALLTALGRTREPTAKLEIAAALAQLHAPRGAAALHDLVERGDDASRLSAALLLADLGDLAGAPPLRQYLDRASGVEGATARVLTALARLGDQDARERLAGLSQTTADEPMRVHAAWSLARLGDEAARAQLSALSQRSGPEQILAARLLASLGDPGAYPLLLAASADDKKPDAAREFALEGLGDCGRADAVPTLLAALEERGASPRLRLAAAGALLQLAAGEPAQLAERSLSWARAALGEGGELDRELAVAVLGDSDTDAALQGLQRALRDKDRAVRRSAALALGRRPGRAALAALGEALGDADPQVRLAAVSALSQSAAALQKAGDSDGERSARQRLDALTRSADEVNRAAASAALAQLGDRGQSDRLRAALAARDPQIRRLAVAALEPVTADEPLLLAALKDNDDEVRLLAARRLAVAGSAAALTVLGELVERGDRIGLLAFAQLRALGREVESPVRRLDLSSVSVAERGAILEAAAELPAAEAGRVLALGALDSAAAVRRRAAELLAALARSSPRSDVYALLRMLGRDPELAVRARASQLLQRLPPPPAATTQKAESPSSARRDPTSGSKPGGSFLLLQGDDGVRVQVDRGPAEPLSPRPLPVSAGRHRISYSGGSQDIRVAAGETVTVRVPVSLLDQLVADASEAMRGKDYGRAQSLLDRAHRVQLRTGGKPAVQAELIYQQGRLHEARGQWREAMTQYTRFLKLPETHQRGESRAAARAAVNRLSPRMGLIQIFSLRDGKCRVTDEYYLPPGDHLISLGGGRTRTVSAQAGVITPVKQCP